MHKSGDHRRDLVQVVPYWVVGLVGFAFFVGRLITRDEEAARDMVHACWAFATVAPILGVAQRVRGDRESTIALVGIAAVIALRELAQFSLAGPWNFVLFGATLLLVSLLLAIGFHELYFRLRPEGGWRTDHQPPPSAR
jgi:hypothetical protein